MEEKQNKSFWDEVIYQIMILNISQVAIYSISIMTLRKLLTAKILKIQKIVYEEDNTESLSKYLVKSYNYIQY